MSTKGAASIFVMTMCLAAHSVRAQVSPVPERYGRQNLTEHILKSDYVTTYLGRLEEQYGDFKVWFPRNRMDAATLVSFVEFEDGVVFVCFSQKTEVIMWNALLPGQAETAFVGTDETMITIKVLGPAVVFPVFPDGGDAKFKDNRYVGVIKKADWSRHDRHFWDEGIAVTFENGTGGHGILVRVMEFDITDRLIGEKEPDDEGRDRRLTDRQALARLMGVYFPGPR